MGINPNLPPDVPVFKAEPEELKIWLEWAGGKLLCMRLSAASPASYRSFWPDYADESAAYGYTSATMRVPAVAPKEVAMVDQILALPMLVEDPTTRRIIHRRALVAPLSGNYVYSYVKIAEELHLDSRLAARKFASGLVQICRRLPAQQASTIRHFLSANPYMNLTHSRVKS
jgi:hypothetical protein